MTRANLNFITDQLATGGDIPTDRSDGEAEAALADLVALGVTHILDNRVEWSDEDWVAERAPQLVYLYNPADDAGEEMPDEWFEDGVAFALAALEDPTAKVLAHCHMGINRGPSMAYAILLAQGWDPVAAIDRIRQVRPIANVWYAEDALDWWHRRTLADSQRRVVQRRALAQWRCENYLDVVRIIREIREAESA